MSLSGSVIYRTGVEEEEEVQIDVEVPHRVCKGDDALVLLQVQLHHFDVGITVALGDGRVLEDEALGLFARRHVVDREDDQGSAEENKAVDDHIFEACGGAGHDNGFAGEAQVCW